MAPAHPHDIVVLADSDIRVEPDYLARVVAALDEPGRRRRDLPLLRRSRRRGMWSRLSALAIDAHFLPGSWSARRSAWRGPASARPSRSGARRWTAIGGFVAFADCLADDYAHRGGAARERASRLSMPPFAVGHVCAEASAGEFWRHELRWALTIRSIDPLGYVGSIRRASAPVGADRRAARRRIGRLPAGARHAVVSHRMPDGLLRQVERAYGLPPHAYWLIPAA